MSIEGCPTCGGEGWIPGEGTLPLSRYEKEGLLERYMAPIGEMIRWTGKGRVVQAGFKKCWCNHQLIHLATRGHRALYWRDEQSGVLAAVVEKFLHHRLLSTSEIDTMKAYVAQWILAIGMLAEDRGVQGGVPKEEWLPALAPISTREELEKVIFHLLDWGMDPL